MKNRVHPMGKGTLLGTIAFYSAIALVVSFFAFPLAWMLLKSFHFTKDIISYEPRFVAQLTLTNYLSAIRETQLVRYVANTMGFAVGGAAMTVLIGSGGAFVIAKIRKPVVAIGILAIRMAPFMLYLVPLFLVFSRIGLNGTIAGSFIGYLMLSVPPATWLLTGFFATTEPSLEEAALIDGADRFQIFFRIVLPQVRPGLVAVFVLAFAQIWNNLIVPLIISSAATQTLPVMISRMQTLYDPTMGKIMASANVTTAPVFLLIIFARKYIVSTFQKLRIG